MHLKRLIVRWCVLVLIAVTLAGAVSLIGQTNSWFPTQVAAMAIAVAISMWYLKHMSWNSGRSCA